MELKKNFIVSLQNHGLINTQQKLEDYKKAEIKLVSSLFNTIIGGRGRGVSELS